jgi:tetratricopeptide (TPR) repeat protein
LALFVAGAITAEATALEVADIILLSVKFKLSDEAVISKIRKDKVVFKLTPEQVLQLKRKGLSDKLVNYMLRTGSPTYKRPQPGAVEKRGEADKPERKLTAAEKVAEEARLKEEALRLIEAQRRREEEQRKAFAGKVLQKGQRLANAGRWVAAVKVFSDFVKNGVHGVPFAPESQEAYISTYGIANALARAGLQQSAANKLLEVVRAGPEKMFFEKAFLQLRELRRRINYRPPELEDLTKFAVVSRPKPFQDSFHYFVGEFLHDFGLSSEAVPYLEKVRDGAIDYPRAQYLLGLIVFQDEALDTATKVRGASVAFQNAVVSAEELDNQGMVDLAFLALARLAYEYRQYDAAIYYYRKISRNSPKLVRAFYESGWTYFLKGDVSRALGTFHALHSPYFRHHFYPELWILEATLYVNDCHPKYAEQAIKRFQDDVLVLGPPLRDFLRRHRRPEEFYEGVVKAVNTPRAAKLPRKLLSPVLQNVEFYNLYKTIRQIEREEVKIKAHLSALDEFGQETLHKLGQLKSERVAEAGVVVQRTLRQVQKDIATYQDRLTELRIDLTEIQMADYDKQIQTIEKTGTEEKAAVEIGSAIAVAGSDSMVWPFEGEFWKDEIGAYRSFLRGQCREVR